MVAARQYVAANSDYTDTDAYPTNMIGHDWSFNVWVKLPTTDNFFLHDALYSNGVKSEGHSLSCKPSASNAILYNSTYSGAAICASCLRSLDAWHCIGCSYDYDPSGAIRWYDDGIYRANTTDTMTSFPQTDVSGDPGYPRIGATQRNYVYGATLYRSATVAHFRWWDRLLSDAEFAELAAGNLASVIGGRTHDLLPFGQILDLLGGIGLTNNGADATDDGPPVFGAL